MEKLETDQSRKVKFQFSGKMARLLGRESVSSEIVALFELVKNAYDADSPKVSVSFDNMSGKDGRIIVRDFGDGMTEYDIINKWLIIGTDSKEREKFTKHGRRVVGQKGIGRFANERLAHKTTLISCPKDGLEVLELKINWDLYEANNAKFEEIEHILNKRPRTDLDKQGLEIILEDLRDEWTQKNIDALSSQFSGLVLPAALETNYPFEIELIAPNFQVSKTKIESSLLKKAPYRLKATLSNNEILIAAWIKEEQVIGVSLDNHRIPNMPMRCGTATLHYYAFPRDPSTRKERAWEKYYGPIEAQLINDMLEVHAGIRLYRDGFRVKPYGDPDNDWTHRERRARAQSGVQPNDRTIGWVEISSENNPQIIDTTTREKVIENDAFRDLVEFVDISIQKLNTIIAKTRKPTSTRRKRDVQSRVAALQEALADSNIPPEQKEQLQKELRELGIEYKDESKQAEEAQEVLMNQIEAYRNLASLGIMTGSVSHEVKQDLSQIIGVSEQLVEIREIREILRTSAPDLDIDDLDRRITNVYEYMSMIRGYTSALKSRSEKFRRKEAINFYEFVNNALKGFNGICDRWNIKPLNTVPINMPEIVMFRADLQSILLNFITNSIKAIKSKIKQQAGQNFGNGSIANIIKVNSHLDPNYFIFSVSDTGVGVHPDIKNTIFDMFVSYNEEEETGQSGSGLGLTIVKEIVESYEGSVFVDKNEFDEGATFTVKIPLTSVRNV